MIDHYPRIRARHMRVLNFRARMIWLAYLAVFLAVLAIAVDGWQKRAELYAEHEAMVKCINGQAVGVDTAVMRCTLRENKPLLLTGEVKS